MRTGDDDMEAAKERERRSRAADDAAKTEKNGASWSTKDQLFSIFRRKSTSQFHSEHYQ